MRLWGRREESVDPAAVKARSMAEVARLGGRTIEGLPTIDPTTARTGEALAQRALALNALVGFAYEAPAGLIREWIATNGLTPSLSAGEAELLRQETEAIDPQAKINLSWSPEAIYALLWAGGLAPSLDLGVELPEDAFAALPRVGQGESGREFSRRVRLRPYAELYAMRDFYYRAHWFARDGRLNGYPTGIFVEGIVMERRKALEWLLDETADWDEVDLST